jgi:hypothetical protein
LTTPCEAEERRRAARSFQARSACGAAFIPTQLLSIAGVDLDKTGVVALEATLAVVAGGAVWMYRSKVKELMGGVH